MVEYAYDAWGNVLSVAGSYASTLGQNNPIRYRGYYYDGSIMINDENNDLFMSFVNELQMLSKDNNQKTEDIFANLKKSSLSFFDAHIKSN